jgi:pSer/pThr/pTyr-binding forkhead associated (FHA) protein
LLREWERFALSAGENVIGRAENASIRLDAAGVSRRHARIVVSAGGVTIEDLDSKNGTTVRGERVTAPRALVDGDDVSVGSVRLLFRQMSSAVATTATVGTDATRPEPTRSSRET